MGFTLVEMLVVVAIIAILTTSVTLGYQSFMRTSNLRGDKILLAAYIRTAQRQAIVYRKDVCLYIKQATAAADQTDYVEARFLSAPGQSCNAANFATGTSIAAIGTFTPSSTVDIQYGLPSADYTKMSYTMTGSGVTLHLSDDGDFAKYGLASGTPVYSTFTLISTSGRVEVFSCGRNTPWASSWC